MDKLDPGDSRPPYQQVAETLRRTLTDGTVPAGSKLEPHAVVAERFGVSVGTVKRAFAELQRDGLIVTRQGQGSYARGSFVKGVAVGPVVNLDVPGQIEARELSPAEIGQIEAGELSPAEIRRLFRELQQRISELESRLAAIEDRPAP